MLVEVGGCSQPTMPVRTRFWRKRTATPSVLQRDRAGDHAPYVRHATPEDLDRLEALLERLRGLPELRERERGFFSRGSTALFHFHEDAGDPYVYAKLKSSFQPVRVTSRQEQSALLAQVQRALGSAS